MSEKTDPTGETPPTSSAAATAVAALQTQVTKLETEVDTLQTENYKLRGQRRDLRSEVGKLEKVKPEEDSIVLTKEQAEDWSAYLKIGKPDEIGQAQTRLVAMERKESVAQAAQHVTADTQYNSEVLLQLTPETATLNVKSVKDAEGKSVNQAYITIDKKETPLTEYAEQNWSVFMPALTSVSNGQQQPASQPVGSGTPFPKQQGQGKPPSEKELTLEEVRERKLADSLYGGI